MKKILGWTLMAPEDGDGGGAGGGAGGEGDKGGGGGSVLDGGAGGGDDGDGDGGDGASGSLLAGDDDGDGQKADGKGADGKDGKKADSAPAEPKPEEIDAYLAKIKKIDLGGADGGPAPAWDDGALKTVAPLFIKHKIGDAAANEIIAAYAKHVSGQYRAAHEADRAVLKSLRDECGKRFGADIRRFAAEGRRGGEHVFGKELFQRLARVEAFGSDPDIIEALARIGRGLTRDGAPGGDKGGAPERGLAERMYGGK
ncbi:MAG TPA: hypothetical protein PKH11_16190 [Planctomycetota bacterium]|nr:hypothetical protein [Planctomycetota bacterium]